MNSAFSPSAYSTMLMTLPTTLLHSENARLSNEIVKRQRIVRPEYMGKLMETKVQLIDLEIIRRSKNEHETENPSSTKSSESAKGCSYCVC